MEVKGTDTELQDIDIINFVSGRK